LTYNFEQTNFSRMTYNLERMEYNVSVKNVTLSENQN